jgi:hypothetical protein
MSNKDERAETRTERLLRLGNNAVTGVVAFYSAALEVVMEESAGKGAGMHELARQLQNVRKELEQSAPTKSTEPLIELKPEPPPLPPSSLIDEIVKHAIAYVRDPPAFFKSCEKGGSAYRLAEAVVAYAEAPTGSSKAVVVQAAIDNVKDDNFDTVPIEDAAFKRMRAAVEAFDRKLSRNAKKKRSR